MGFLNKLLGRRVQNDTKAKAVPTVACPHVSLVPHWDSVEDMGHEERATSFICDACHQAFTPQVAAALRRTETERLNKKLTWKRRRTRDQPIIKWVSKSQKRPLAHNFGGEPDLAVLQNHRTKDLVAAAAGQTG
jgi:hypothetical protein